MARAIATLTYKSEALFEQRFANRPDRAGGDPSRSLGDRFDVEGYLAHQGDVFVDRFDANSYLVLTRAMDLFDLRGRERPAGRRAPDLRRDRRRSALPAGVRVGVRGALGRGAAGTPTTAHLHSDHGHDAFLAEPKNLAAALHGAVASAASVTAR